MGARDNGIVEVAGSRPAVSNGPVAQLGERPVRSRKVIGPTPIRSTM